MPVDEQDSTVEESEESESSSDETISASSDEAKEALDEEKDLQNCEQMKHLPPSLAPDLDDPQKGKPRWREFRFGFLN